MDYGVVIAAAGLGKRMGTEEKKQFIHLEDKPVLYHSVGLFSGIENIRKIVVVVSADDVLRTQALLSDFERITVVVGGQERQESVYMGLQALNGVEYVLIHDAARPFASVKLIEALMGKAVEAGAAIPAIPVKDTIKMINVQREVISTPPRQSLWAVQTPQAFRLSSIQQAHQEAARQGYIGTDDAMLLEWQGKRVVIVDGEYTNIKITTPEDLPIGEHILKQKKREGHV